MLETKETIKISKKLHLLYVEDDERARESTLEVLENFFVNITTAVDGVEGLEKFKTNSFDIILTDINMPRMNGLEMVKEIRATNKDISILILSAHDESSLLLDGIYLGVDGYILKPLKLEQFLMSLAKVCEKIELIQEKENYKLHLEEEVNKKTAELQQKLYLDNLTSLSSRYAFFEDIESIKTPIVMIVDINKFKLINEIYGADVGTLVLKKFANFLASFSQERNYKAYRLSGDEFLLRDRLNHIDTDKIEKDIEAFFKFLSSFEVCIENDTISIEVSIGISISEHDAFEAAKIALDYAKEQKTRYAIYTPLIDIRKKEQSALEWKNRIKNAIANDNVVAVYQAIVNSQGDVVKYEALMRLKDENSAELVTPYHFLDIAIKTGLYPALSSTVIFEALHFLQSSEQTVSINFMYSDINNKDFLVEIENFFKLHKEVAKWAVFEITESESISDYNVVKQFIKRFRAYGVRFAIDDFGSGFSNFEYILEIEPDYLKIDGSLVKNIDSDEKSHILVAAIVKFSHKLGIKTIAEFVHSKKIFEMLKELEVDEYQGFYFAEPQEEKNLLIGEKDV